MTRQTTGCRPPWNSERTLFLHDSILYLSQIYHPLHSDLQSYRILNQSSPSTPLQPPPSKHTPAIQHNMPPINMPRGPTRQINHRRRHILWQPQPSIWRILLQLLRPSLQFHQPIRHLRREEARRDCIDQNPLRTELDGQVACQV